MTVRICLLVILSTSFLFAQNEAQPIEEKIIAEYHKVGESGGEQPHDHDQ